MSSFDPSMMDLFREEVRAHTATLSAGLLELEGDPANPQRIEPLMRAAHSVKGAARIMGLDLAVKLAHVMEDLLVAAQTGKLRINTADIDVLLKGTDVLATLGELDASGVDAWSDHNAAAIAELEPSLAARAKGEAIPVVKASVTPPIEVAVTLPLPPAITSPEIPAEPLTLDGSHTMLDLFREEVRANAIVLREALAREAIEPMMEALRLVRSAARIVNLPAIESLAAAMAASVQRGLPFTPERTAWLRYATDLLAGTIGTTDETFPQWLDENLITLAHAAGVLNDTPTTPASGGRQSPEPKHDVMPDVSSPPVTTQSVATDLARGAEAPRSPVAAPAEAEPVVRVAARSLNRLMGLAGESLVQARWLQPFSTSMMRLKKQHDILAGTLHALAQSVAEAPTAEHVPPLIATAERQLASCRQELASQTSSFDDHAARAEDLNSRLYREVIVSRMRPFADGTHGLPRMVRDMARTLGKQLRFVLEGETTDVDRDVLEKLEAPLTHLIRNAVDHGIEMPADRVNAGKPEQGTIRVEARHNAGMLLVTVTDDGRGIDLDRLRRKIVDRGLSSAELVARMTEAELLEFLFLPGFSTASSVSEFSGRGVGLDVVQDIARKVGGQARITSRPGLGTVFHLQMPITLSVIRAVIVDISGEPYAFPHTRIDRLLRIPRREIHSVEHRQFVAVGERSVGLVLAAQVLDLAGEPPTGSDLLVVLLADASGAYGLVVDRFRGEQDLVVRPLDPRLGKVPNLSAAAVLDDGTPVLIVDVEDMIRSTDQFIQTGSLQRCEETRTGLLRRKRILIVDDSITVREVERQLLRHKGYDVTVAVDGMDGWNKARAEPFDLIITDVDMPRMTGLQLVKAIRDSATLRDLPVVIVSYKEREEDRLRGLEVGANAYLTKSSFHDNRFVEAVEDLIGAAEE